MKSAIQQLFTASCILTLAMPSLSSAAILVNDQFIDNGRTDGADALDINWYSWQAANNTLSIASDSITGPNEGSPDNALNLAVGNQGFRGVTGILPSAFTLSNTGDNITLQYDMVYTAIAGSNSAGVRFGLYNSQGTVAADGGVNQTNDIGYLARVSNGTGTGAAEIWRETGGNGAPTSGTDTALIAGGAGSGAGNVNTSYVRLSLSITRNSLSGLDLILMQGVNTTTLSTVWSVTEAFGSVTTYTFDEVALGTGTSNPDFRIDNVLVTTSAIPEPSTYAMFGSGLLALAILRKRNRFYKS